MSEPLLISTGELAGRLGEDGLRVVDTRFSLAGDELGEQEHERAHIPGAVYLHWYRDLSDPDDDVLGQLAPLPRFAETMERAGIGDETTVVAYDDGVIFMAARLYWSLLNYGHERVRVLDGGWPAWIREGRPTEAGHVAMEAGASFSGGVPRPGLRATKADVLAALAGDTRILDCRMDGTWYAAGAHIPGAARLPAPSLVDEAGLLRAPDAIAARAREAGVDPGDDVILYCGGGISASLAFAALTSAGYRHLRVYDGSWSEWSADPATPRESHA